MNNKEAIIDKIITDANNKAGEILSIAEAKKKEIVDKANSDAKVIFDANVGKGKVAAEEILKRKSVVAKLDNKKNLLARKKDMVAKVFEDAINAFVGEKDYLDIVSAMIAQSAEDGDEVAICKIDKDKITAAFVEKVAKKCGKKITLSKNFVDIQGGVVLVGKHCDKNLSLDLEFATLREKIESEVVDILFEEKK
ncbi:MAG: V-type ATP synthase subunit E family protein [Clostridia bacterium]